jgi:hypothetical protein
MIPGMADVTRSLAGARIALGSAAWAAPDPFVRALGFRPSPEMRFLARLFAVRDAAVGAAVLVAGPQRRAAVVAAAMLCDVSDAVCGVRGMRAEGLGWRIGLLAGGGGIAAVAAGLLSLREARAEAAAAGDPPAGDDDALARFYAASSSLKRPARSAASSSSNPPID